MSDPYFFGYGSLVNTRTHSYPDPQPATLRGWRRAWVATPRFGVVLLTGVRAKDHKIDGLIAKVPDADWGALDAREAGYDRLAAHEDVIHSHTAARDIAVYAVNARAMLKREDQVILLSYLDVVVQGFHEVYGKDGVRRFFDTTDGWDTPILNDRDAPAYPRHQSLSQPETDLVDDHLQRLSVRVQAWEDGALPPDFL